jgi:hypothetical protein
MRSVICGASRAGGTVGGVVEQHPPGPHEACVDVGLVPGATRPRRATDVELPDPGPQQPRHLLRLQPAARQQQPGHVLVGGGAVDEVVEAGLEPAGRAGGVHGVDARKPHDLSPYPSALERGVDRPGERPGHSGQLRGEMPADLLVDQQVGVEEPEHQTLGTDVEVGLREPDQPGQLAAGRGVRVVEPQQHPDRQLGLLAHAGHQGGLG